MESQTLDTLDITRIENSVEEAVAKIDELARWLPRQGGQSTWENPLPAIRDQLSVGVAALNQIRSAHRSALENVNIQESTVRQQNEFERSRLNDKQAELEKWQNEVRERERKLDMREGGLNATDKQLGTRSRELDARQSKLDRDIETHFIERGRLAEREDHLKTAEAKNEKKSAILANYVTKTSELQREVLHNLTVQEPELSGVLCNLTVREFEPTASAPGTPGTPAPATSASATPASDKRKRAALAQRPLKRVSQGLEEASDDGRPMSSELAEFGGFLESPKTSEGSIPDSPPPAPQPSSSSAQPVGASSASGAQPVPPPASTPAQVPRWINEDVAPEIRVIWAEMEFSHPELWTEADGTKFKTLLQRYQDKGGNVRPVVKLANCNSQQEKGTETCYECKSSSKGSGEFDNGRDHACRLCSAQRRPCFRVTRTNNKWLITLRQ